MVSIYLYVIYFLVFLVIDMYSVFCSRFFSPRIYSQNVFSILKAFVVIFYIYILVSYLFQRRHPYIYFSSLIIPFSIIYPLKILIFAWLDINLSRDNHSNYYAHFVSFDDLQETFFLFFCCAFVSGGQPQQIVQYIIRYGHKPVPKPFSYSLLLLLLLVIVIVPNTLSSKIFK